MNSAQSHVPAPSSRELRTRCVSNIVLKDGEQSRRSMAAERVAEGDLAIAQREPEVAIAEYGHALALLEDASPTVIAGVHVRLGHAHRLLADGEARDHYELALTLDKRQITALRCLVEDYSEVGCWYAVAELEEQLFAAFDDDAHRSIEMVLSGDRWLARADAPGHARVRYARALATNPASHAAQRRLSGMGAR